MTRSPKPKPPPNPFRWFDFSPEVIRLLVMMFAGDRLIPVGTWDANTAQIVLFPTCEATGIRSSLLRRSRCMPLYGDVTLECA